MVEEVALWQHFKDVRKDPTVGETDCYVYLQGGRDGDNCVTNTVERFSVRIDVWGQADPVQIKRTGACSAVIEAIIYIIGGSYGEEVLKSV